MIISNSCTQNIEFRIIFQHQSNRSFNHSNNCDWDFSNASIGLRKENEKAEEKVQSKNAINFVIFRIFISFDKQSIEVTCGDSIFILALIE